MKRLLISLCLLATIILGVIGYTQIMLRSGSGTPPAMAAQQDQADQIIVSKSDYTLTLMKNGQPIKTYPIVMGGVPSGPKQFEGDERTPEGTYTIDWRNPNSIAHLSLHISYPNADDVAYAKAMGQSAGGNIMIHGALNGWGWADRILQRWNWTNGCIAVTNADMRDIWSRVPNGTPIEIKA
ncbi:MAG: L,D-transpeptidase family protein [Planktomarina sp.]